MASESIQSMKGLKEYRRIWKQEGIKGLVAKAGWKATILLFLFFLIKGLLWLAIPYLVAQGLIYA